MNTCTSWAALLDPYVDGELETEDMLRLQAHLAECPACRAYVDDALAIRAAFPQAEETELPEDFHRSVMAAVAAQAGRKRSRPLRTLLPLAAACFALVVLAQGIPLGGMKEKAYPVSAADSAPASSVMESAAAAEEPAAPQLYGAAVEDLAPAPSCAGQGGEAQAAKDAPSVKTTSQNRSYDATLTITAAQAEEALSGRSPITLEDGRRAYELDWADYQALLTRLALPEDPEVGTEGEAPPSLALVIVGD